DEPDSPHIRVPIRLREAEALGQVRAHDVAVQHGYHAAACGQPGLERAGNGRLTGAAEARKPDAESPAAHHKRLTRSEVRRSTAIGLCRTSAGPVRSSRTVTPRSSAPGASVAERPKAWTALVT